MMETTAQHKTSFALIPVSASINSRLALGHALIHASLAPAAMQRLLGVGPFGMVVVAPSPAHVDIIADAFEQLAVDVDVHSFDEPTPWEARELVDNLSRGKLVVAICSDPAQIPASFKALADEVVHFRAHDARTIRKTMAKVLDGPAPRFGKRFIVHPDPELLCRCIVPGLAPTKVVEALTRLGELCRKGDDDRLPNLDQAIEFGEARTWGLRVRSELAAWRAGKLDAEDMDRSVLLVSPPGYGKTMFARVLAKALDAPLIDLKLGDLFVRRGHLGDVIAELRERFSAAVAAAPAVLLLDELDSLGRRDERESSSAFKTGLINELLTLLDGAGHRRPGLVVVGATNAPHSIDPAMRRPGRLGRTIELALPGPDGIENVLRYHLRGDLRYEALDEVVRRNRDNTPAELMDLVRRARQDARSERRRLHVLDLIAQSEPESPLDWQMMNRVAIHEAGHALACLLLPEAPFLHSVSIGRSGNAMGQTMTTKLQGATTRTRLEGQVMVFLAGRAAEALVFGDADPSDGATGDLQVATAILCRIHASWGMGETLVHITDPEELLLTNASFAKRIGEELDLLMSEVTEALKGREVYLRAIAFDLCRRRSLSGRDVGAIVQEVNAVADEVANGNEMLVSA